VVGVDVGEDFLDLAVLRIASLELEHHRIALGGIEEDALGTLRQLLRASWPNADAGWLVLIDSPRWPRDLDCSRGSVAARDPIPTSRALDRALRERLRASAQHSAIRLSMFPTLTLAYFEQCAARSDCKPHLRSIYRWLFETEPNPQGPSEQIAATAGRIAGGTFTRFMLAGFLTFRAWDAVGVQALEAYPELQYRLCGGDLIASKREGTAAVLRTRVETIQQLRHTLAIVPSPLPATIDQADAEILALSALRAAERGSLAALEHPAEGRFLLTF
jgi:hypothetical protein